MFDKTDGMPVIARQDDCQTCFLCELYCPEDSLFVAAYADGPETIDVSALKQSGKFGSYRRAVVGPKKPRKREASTEAMCCSDIELSMPVESNFSEHEASKEYNG